MWASGKPRLAPFAPSAAATTAFPPISRPESPQWLPVLRAEEGVRVGTPSPLSGLLLPCALWRLTGQNSDGALGGRPLPACGPPTPRGALGPERGLTTPEPRFIQTMVRDGFPVQEQLKTASEPRSTSRDWGSAVIRGPTAGGGAGGGREGALVGWELRMLPVAAAPHPRSPHFPVPVHLSPLQPPPLHFGPCPARPPPEPASLWPPQGETAPP